MNSPRKAKKTAKTKPARQTMPGFAQLLSSDPEFAAVRADYARKPAKERRAAAEWAYDASIGDNLFGAMVARIGGEPWRAPKWPPGFAALAIDPEYAPALLTVGCYEHHCGRTAEGLSLLLQLTRLSPKTKDWIEIIDKAGQGLVDAGDAAGACRLYEAALEASPGEQEFIICLGWALGRMGKKQEALLWMERAVANDPNNSHVLSDYGWGLTELGRFDEAQKVLEKAVRLAPAGYHLPANNLKHLQQLRKNAQRQHGTRQVQ